MVSAGSRGLAYHERSYWEARFESDPRECGDAGGFEWLSTGSELLDRTKALIQARPDRQLNILHIGVGTSSLSSQLMLFYNTRFPLDWRERCSRIVNVDFAAGSTLFQQRAERELLKHTKIQDSEDDEALLMQYHTLDLLDLASIRMQIGSCKYDLILDKSTTDSISTSPDVVLNDTFTGAETTCIGPTTQLLAMNLATIANDECIWLCHSYSSDRWQDLVWSTRFDMFPWSEKGKYAVELVQSSAHAPVLYHYIYEMQRKASVPY